MPLINWLNKPLSVLLNMPLNMPLFFVVAIALRLPPILLPPFALVNWVAVSNLTSQNCHVDC